MPLEQERATQPPVLILDEDEVFVEVAQMVLKDLGIEPIYKASSVLQGEQILSQGLIKSIITNLKFPDGDGIGVLENCGRQIRAWVATGEDDPDAEHYCREVLGIVDWLKKPVDIAVLSASFIQETPANVRSK